MGFSLDVSVPAITVFVQGILSFFSPCVLPLAPLYVGYLAGGTKTIDEQGNISYSRKTVLLNTVFFVLGISCAFFLLGLGFTALGQFLSSNRIWFARLSGVVMIFWGLYQLGVLGTVNAFARERRFTIRLDRWTMNPLTALVLGFTFSFAWTPCVGPTLGSVLLLASSSDNAEIGFLMIGIYTLGFVVPFLCVGLFTGSVLGFFKRHQHVVRYTVKIGAILLILMGIMTLTGFMNGITSYLSSTNNGSVQAEQPQSSSAAIKENNEQVLDAEQVPEDAIEYPIIPAPDFQLLDQLGNEHTLSDYKGKTVFLNFWATWCGPCQSEMPEIQALYERYGYNKEELVVLGVVNPKSEEYPYNQDKAEDEIISFLEDGGYSFPVVMDKTGEVFEVYGIRAFPTTFMIDKDGNVFGYVVSALTGEMMESIVQQTMSGERVK